MISAFDRMGLFDFEEDADDKYLYSSDEFCEYVHAMIGNGVCECIGNKLAATAANLVITIGTGACWIKGKLGIAASPKTVTLNAITQGMQQIDRIVAEVDYVNMTMGINTVIGTPAAANPQAPALIQNAFFWQMPLWRVLITNGGETQLTDERNYILSLERMAYLAGTVDLTAGVTPLDNGKLYFLYEE